MDLRNKTLPTTKFGQVVLGPPGSGKTTYCKAIASLLKDLGRKVDIVNLDPANDQLPYNASIDINELITVEEVMETQSVGPNGALVFSMDLLKENLSWLFDKIEKSEAGYFIFDFPGQAELYTHHTMIRDILNAFQKIDLRICSVYLVDSHYANDPGKYVSTLLLTLNSMLQMECATVNVLSKVDSVEKFGKLKFGLDFYTEVLDLEYLFDALEDNPLTKKYSTLNKTIAEVVTDYGLVTFLPLSVDNRSTLLNVMKSVDKANGYVYGAQEERSIQRLLSCAVGAELEHERIGTFRDMYTDPIEESSDSSDSEEKAILKMLATQNAP